MRKLTLILLLAACGLGALPARAVFENVMVSPRARAMGDASVAYVDAPFAVTHNPAGLADAGNALGTTYVQPYGLDFARQVYLGGAVRVGRAGGVGFAYRRFGTDYEDVDLLKESTFTAGHGLNLYDDLHSSIRFGYALNVYRLEFGETVSGFDPGSATSVGVDLGLLVTLHERTQIGFLVHNLNTPKIGEDEEEIPQRLHAGISYEPYTGVVTTFEFESEPGYQVQMHGGLEFQVIAGLALRAGVMSNPSKLTAGLGYAFDHLGVPIAFQYGFSTGGGVLDSTHQFGLTVAWGGENQ